MDCLYYILTLLTEPPATVWIGTEGNGVLRYSVKAFSSGGIIARMKARYTQNSGLSDENIRSLLADRDGTIWVGTRFGGANRFLFCGDSVCRIIRYGPEEGLSGNWVREMMQDRAGKLWFATNRGVDRL